MLPTLPPEIDIKEMSPLALAFVGDAVLEILVRSRLVGTTRLQPGRLHSVATQYVSARAQFRELAALEPLLTEQEAAVLRRGKNASKASVAKHATAQEYRASTGLECLLGWLYLQGQNDRIAQLFEVLWQAGGPEAAAVHLALGGRLLVHAVLGALGGLRGLGALGAVAVFRIACHSHLLLSILTGAAFRSLP